MEEWRDIRGYEGIYQVSKLGRVKSLKFGKERILSLGKTTSGHMQATLLKNIREFQMPDTQNVSCNWIGMFNVKENKFVKITKLNYN